MKAVLQVTGFSGSGKTTLMADLIARLVARGDRVAAIKHTHHDVNDRNAGDTARFRAAGAEIALLAGDGVAVVFAGGATTRVVYEKPGDLLAFTNDADVVLVEGFKSYHGWPRIEAAAGVGEAMKILDRIDAPMTLRYRAVLFDLDGTLVDSYNALAEAVNFARRQHGLHELSGARIRDFVGDGLETLLQRAFESAHVPRSVRDAFETRYDEICCEESKVLADVETTLEELAKLNVMMAVCTNKPTSFSRKILEFLGLARHFSAIVGPDLAGARKPEAQHLLCTLQSTNIAAADALFVGDMPIDVHAARNSGIDVAVVPTGSSSAEQLHAARPDHYLDRFSDLLKIVAR